MQTITTIDFDFAKSVYQVRINAVGQVKTAHSPQEPYKTSARQLTPRRRWVWGVRMGFREC
jgi:hypothetical protein